MKSHERILKMVLAALFLALAYVLPFLTGQIPEVGSMLCPMHLPVLICGFICGWPWGLAVGVIAPLSRSLTLSMPPLFPTALCMSLELATYGAIAGLMHRLLPKKRIYMLYKHYNRALCKSQLFLQSLPYRVPARHRRNPKLQHAPICSKMSSIP